MGSTDRPPHPGGETDTASSPEASAVLYVCAERSKEIAGLSTQRAADEGRSFAENHQLRIVAEIIDPYGEPEPQKREGWLQVRGMADAGDIAAVITRWPNCVSPEHELRYPEIAWLKERSVSVLFSWAPLSVLGDGR